MVLKKFVLKAQNIKLQKKTRKRVLQEAIYGFIFYCVNLGRPVTCQFLDLLLGKWLTSATEDLWLSSLSLVAVFLNDETIKRKAIVVVLNASSVHNLEALTAVDGAAEFLVHVK